MPSAMIHLITALALEPEGSDRFLLGSISPDAANGREFKDGVHLRDRADRVAALQELRSRLDLSEDFSRGWLLHLFTDYCWDETHLRDFREAHAADPDWFERYHRELHQGGYELYDRSPRAAADFDRMTALPLEDLPGFLPVTAESIDRFRRIMREKHRTTPRRREPSVFTPALAERFAAETAAAFRESFPGTEP